MALEHSRNSPVLKLYTLLSLPGFSFCWSPSLTLLLLLLFLLLKLAFLDTAQLGLADAPSLADGLKQSGPAAGGVNHLLRGSLNRGCEENGEGQLSITGQGKAVQPQAGRCLRSLTNRN